MLNGKAPLLFFLVVMAPVFLLSQARGRVVSSDASRPLVHPIPVDVEFAGRIIGRTFTDSLGNFVYDDIEGINTVHVQINEPGFRPVRVEVPVVLGRGKAPPTAVMLDPLTAGANPIDPNAVDIERLSRDAPNPALVTALGEADVLSGNGDHAAAAVLLEEAVELDPDFFPAQNALGVAYQQLGRREDAIRHFLIAKGLDPNAAQPALSVGVMFLEDSDRLRSGGDLAATRSALDQALGHLEDAVERDPRSALGQYYLGAAHYRAGAAANALDRLERALSLNPRLYDVHLLMFNIYLAQQNFADALDQLTTYLAVYPESPQRETVEQRKAALELQMSGR